MQDNMPLELVQIDIRPGSEGDFVKDLRTVLGPVLAADGCYGVSLHRSLERPDRFRLFVRWKSVEQHVAFRATEEVKPIRAVFARYMVAKADTEHLFLIDALGEGTPK